MEEHQVFRNYNSVSIEELYRGSFKILIDNIVICIANTFILLVTCFLFGITIIGLLALPGIVGGYIGSMIRIVLGNDVEIGDFIKLGLNDFGSLLGAKIIYQIGVFVGCLFFILPGLYLMMKWSFVNHLIINQKKSIGDAFSESSNMTSGILWDIFVIWILNTIISTICGPFFFVSMPFVTIVYAKYYTSRLK